MAILIWSEANTILPPKSWTDSIPRPTSLVNSVCALFTSNKPFKTKPTIAVPIAFSLVSCLPISKSTSFWAFDVAFFISATFPSFVIMSSTIEIVLSRAWLVILLNPGIAPNKPKKVSVGPKASKAEFLKSWLASNCFLLY